MDSENFVSLKEYCEGLYKSLDEKIIASNKLFDEKFGRMEDMISHVEKLLSLTQSTAREATTKSEEAIKTHFASVNEFNDRMKAVVNQQASKEWAEGFEKSTDLRFKAIEIRDSQREGRAQGIKISTGFLVTALTVATMIISTVIIISRYIKG